MDGSVCNATQRKRTHLELHCLCTWAKSSHGCSARRLWAFHAPARRAPCRGGEVTPRPERARVGSSKREQQPRRGAPESLAVASRYEAAPQRQAMEGLLLEGLSSLPMFNLLFGGDGDNQSIGAGSEAASRARATSQKKASTARNLDVVRMHRRILAVGKPWDRRTEKEAHRNNAAELGRALERKYGRRYLMVNLSGACAGSACGNGTGLSSSKTAASLSGKVDYHRLRYQVLECDLESKPSLETLFRLCHAVKLFLSLDSRNVIAIFCKNGVHTCRLFLSAYFAFIGKFPDTNAALEDFYYRRVRVNYDAQHILMHAQPSLRHFLQQFQSTIQNDGVPHRKPLVAFMLLIEHLPRIADKGLMKTNIFNIFGPSADEVDRTVQPIVRIYQTRGNCRRVLVYSSLSDPDSCVHWDPAVGKLRLKCNVELLGDAEIDCVFPGDTNKHLFRYFMHTSFMPESGVVTVTRTDIQTASKHVFPENFKMEIIVQPGQIPAKGTNECAAIEDTFRFLRSKIPCEDALTILSDLHFINPDPQLCRKLTAAGHPEQQVRFALQRTNNVIQVARELLKPKDTPNKDDSKSPPSLQSPKDEAMEPVSPVSDSSFSEAQGEPDRTPDKLVANTSIIISPPRTSSLPYIRDEEMTSELETMLDRLQSPALHCARKQLQVAKGLQSIEAIPTQALGVSQAACQGDSVKTSNASEVPSAKPLIRLDDEKSGYTELSKVAKVDPAKKEVAGRRSSGAPCAALVQKGKDSSITDQDDSKMEETLLCDQTASRGKELKLEGQHTVLKKMDAEDTNISRLGELEQPILQKKATSSVRTACQSTTVDPRQALLKMLQKRGVNEPKADEQLTVKASQTCTSDPDPHQALMTIIQKRASPSQDDLVARSKNTAGDAPRAERTNPSGDSRQALMAMIQKRAPSCHAESPRSLGAKTIEPHTTSQNIAPQPLQGEMPERAGNTTRANSVEVAKSNVDTPKEVAKFKRMLSVGVPEGAVRAKMMQDNVDPALLFGVNTTVKSRGPPPPEYAKFDKMLKMGVPEGAVVAKMRLENLDPTWIGIGVEIGSRQQPGQQPVTKPRDNVRRKKFHWEAIPESRLKQNSIWTVSRGVAKFRRGAARAQDKLQIETKEVKARTEHDQHSAIACDQRSQQQQQRGRRGSLGSVASDGGLLSPTHVIADETDPDMKELELLFTMRPAAANASCASNAAQKAGTSSKPAAKAKKATRVALLDMKRSQNVSIGLKRIKLSGKDICTALNAFDDEVLTHERLQILQSAQMLPTQEEEKVLGGFRGNASTLGEAEQFLREIVLSVQEPKIRLDAMYFRAEFSERLQELNARVDLVRRACKSVRDSQSLQKVFQVVLLVGNKINAEGPASIRGFTVASLLKLSQTKSFNRKTTILDFIAQFATKRIPEVLDVDTELSVLGEAKRLQFAVFDAEESGLHMGYQAMMRAIKAAERETKADVRTPKGEARQNGAKFQVDAASADQAFASSDEGAASHGLERLCAFSRDVQDALSQLEASLEAMRDEYSNLLEFFCEEADLPAQDFFATLDTFLKSFGTAARNFRETQGRKAARERAERQRLTLKRSESLRGGCGRKGDTPGSSFETPRKAKSFRDPRPRAVGDSPCGNAQVSGRSSSLSFRTPQPRKLMQQENEVENCSENVSCSAGPKVRSKPLSQTPSLSKFLAEI